MHKHAKAQTGATVLKNKCQLSGQISSETYKKIFRKCFKRISTNDFRGALYRTT